MTHQPEPIRKSSLPTTPPPEWEFFTFFPYPDDDGGDMVRGQRQRGVQVRRLVTYGDWEPVCPDRWADEPERAAVSAAVAPPTNRATIYREAADDLATAFGDPMVKHIGALGASHLRRRARELEAGQRRMADETATQTPDVTVHAAPDLSPTAETALGALIDVAKQQATEGWQGATEVISDAEVQRLAATGLVGYRQGRGQLLHCLHHKPVPASRWADFHEVTADDLPDGGICVHPRCGADLLAVQPAAGARQDEPPTTHTYLSTGCLHGHHDYCQNHTGQSGEKQPAQCKFCAAPCTCHCHTTAGEQR